MSHCLVQFYIQSMSEAQSPPPLFPCMCVLEFVTLRGPDLTEPKFKVLKSRGLHLKDEGELCMNGGGGFLCLCVMGSQLCEDYLFVD